MVKKVNNIEFEREIFNNKIVVVDFFATWCGPCQMYGPIFEQVSNELSNVVFLKVNVDENNELATKEKANTIPTTKIFVNKKEVDKHIGFLDAKTLHAIINKHIKE